MSRASFSLRALAVCKRTFFKAFQEAQIREAKAKAAKATTGTLLARQIESCFDSKVPYDLFLFLNK